MSSGPAECDLRYGPEHTYSVSVVRPGSAATPTRVRVKPDGSFTTSVLIPPSFPPGDAAIVVTGSPYDDCADTGYGSCAGYAVNLTVRSGA